MTLEEKLGQLTMFPGASGQTGPAVPPAADSAVRAGAIGSFLSIWSVRDTRRLQGLALQSRLKIPLVFAYDVIHGWRTVFPVPLGMAATFDSAGTAQAARIAAVEAAAAGVHWTFAPMVDIARDPRWGRIVEGAGEDPYLGSVLAAAQVVGFQGDRGQLAGAAPPPTDVLLATPKHFAGYGFAEGGRDYNTVELTERTLWDVVMPPFEAAIRAGAATIMASFNEIGGTPAHASRWLLQDVLRDRWRFGGLVVSDWTGVAELIPHGLGDSATVAGRAIRAGVDVEMSSTLYRSTLAAEIRAGRVPIAAVDSAVVRLLRAKHALGLFDDPYRYSDSTRERRVLLTAEHRRAAREIARRAIVLLENRATGGAPTLPLRKALRTVAVIGPLADDPKSALGNWWGAGKPEDVVSPLAGLRRALPNARITHVRGAPADTTDTTGFAAARAAARDAEAVVLVLGERQDMSAEASSRASIELPGAQLALARAVLQAARASSPAKPVVTVLLNGRPLAVPWLADSMPALVESWFLGVEHGNALADVLLGDADPGGRLPVTVPRATGQVPIYYNHKLTGRPANANNHYTSKYIDLPWTPLYPFGFGRSYATFAYSDLRVPATGRTADSLVVSVTVANTSSRAGDEVVQLYVRDDAGSVTRPVRELKGFQRVTLGAGERRTVRFTLKPEHLAFTALDMRRVVEPGAFTVWAGGSSAATLEGRFRLSGDTVVVAPAPPPYR
ncbi:glycoside hydrolase family 3 N-terminal domain-containing protein [Roseisolibacter sp. H3M3-2]|uniref:glycoside hydrolase family 3 N-terminal domain-containing protein n=1 Tax=Roseisolibacter sp. H3M3-2 TaxID=3031323 RepID=UPI0023DCA261|nr:glycoside hydrolase family 3 N-terminal domain-containing protein [Roseisolibacter sp. H3M3-2]MDF1501570.1 glycoside hydrolase family 3 N-terminal domain-containing protein [Roseisolibacter sp. H3M3-2]